MPLIVYGGHTPVVSVPQFQLADVERGVPVEVPEHVARELTLDGASPAWSRVEATDLSDDPAGDVVVDQTPEG